MFESRDKYAPDPVYFTFVFVIFRRVGDLAPINALCYEVKSKCCSAVAVKSAAHCTKVSVVLFCTNLSSTCVRLFKLLSLKNFMP